jgi:RNA polymerase sigma factor (sigma-70 family)
VKAYEATAIASRDEVGTPVARAEAGDEIRVVRRAQAGDLAAFERLYRATVGLVHALCVRAVGDRSRAEDLVQDVYVRAWRKLSSFRGESAFATWLARLTVNLAFSERRGWARRQAAAIAADDLEALAGSTPASHPGTHVDLERAIAALPPGARAAFVLHDVHGYAHAEIASLTGTSVGTSKAQLHRARKLLREVLK